MDTRGLERATANQYAQHVNLHIAPFIGATKLSKLNIASVRAFEDRLREEGALPSNGMQNIGEPWFTFI